MDCLDLSVPYIILGTNSLSFVNKNLKNAELFPGLNNFNSFSVENYNEASSKWYFNSFTFNSIYTGVLLAVTVI